MKELIRYGIMKDYTTAEYERCVGRVLKRIRNELTGKDLIGYGAIRNGRKVEVHFNYNDSSVHRTRWGKGEKHEGVTHD